MNSATRPTARVTLQRLAASATLAAAPLVVALATPAAASGPDIERATYGDRYEDDFIRDLYGIETWTTVTEKSTSKRFADGSGTFHVVRTFLPDDPRIPIEKGAATSLIAPDGPRTVVGKPIQLFGPDRGTRMGLDRPIDTDWSVPRP